MISDMSCSCFFSTFWTGVLASLVGAWSSPFNRRTCPVKKIYTAISRKVVGKSARDNLERYCGWLWGHCSSKKFERMVREATDICLRVLKESNKSRFDSFSRYEQCIDHIPYYLSGLSRAHFSRQPFSKQLYTTVEPRVNEGPRDWQNVFAISRFFFIYLAMTGVKKIVRYTEDFVI